MENILLALGLIVVGSAAFGFAVCFKLYVVKGKGDGE